MGNKAADEAVSIDFRGDVSMFQKYRLNLEFKYENTDKVMSCFCSRDIPIIGLPKRSNKYAKALEC